MKLFSTFALFAIFSFSTVGSVQAKVDPTRLKPNVATTKAPDKFSVEFETTKGKVEAEFVRSWAPNGVDRIYNLVKMGYFEDLAFFRVVPKFVVQFGIHGNPKVSKSWREASIQDDKVKESNKRGMISFAATSQPNSRTVQVFVNLQDNTRLDSMGFAPVGRITKGMEIIDKLYGGYGDTRGPNQSLIQEQGNSYLKKSFPKLDYLKVAKLK